MNVAPESNIGWDPIDFANEIGQMRVESAQQSDPGFIERMLIAGHRIRVLAEKPIELIIASLGADEDTLGKP